MTRQEEISILVSLKDQASKGMAKIKRNVTSLVGAYIGFQAANVIVGQSIKLNADYEASLKSMAVVAETTGRDANEVFEAMRSQLHGIASKASMADTFMKQLTTTLDVDQMNNLTTAIRDASLAMGEDFNVQLPLIIKAVKQLNPAILDNIGVTVRLDKVNKKIRDGFYGVRTEINEATQQHAIYTEIIKQTTQYQGLEAQLMDTTKGKIMGLTAAVSDLGVSFGGLLNIVAKPGIGFMAESIRGLTEAVDWLNDALKTEPEVQIEDVGTVAEETAKQIDELTQSFKDGTIAIEELRTGMADAIESMREGAAVSLKEITEHVIETSRSNIEAFQKLKQGWMLGKITFDEMLEAQLRVNEAFRKMAEESANIESWFEDIYDPSVLLQKVDADEMVKVGQVIGGLIAQGFTFESEQQLQKLLHEQFGFTQEQLDAVFKTPVEAAVENAEAIMRAHKNFKVEIFQTEIDAIAEMREQERDDYIEWLSDNEQTEEEMAMEHGEALFKITADRLKKEKVARDKQHATEAAAIMKTNRLFKRYTDRMVSDMLDGSFQLRDIFKMMAGDFLRYFIDEVIKDMTKILIPKLLKLLALFDVAENDRFAMRQGSDFAGYFIRGAVDRFASADLAGAVNIWGGEIGLSQGRQYAAYHNENMQRGFLTDNFALSRESEPAVIQRIVQINISGNVYDIDHLRDEIIPAIEDESEHGTSRIALDEDSRTGAADGFIY
jgi:hypothetical protein